MSANWAGDVKQFMVAMGQGVLDRPGNSVDGTPGCIENEEGQSLYEGLMNEEHLEFRDAESLADSVDGAIDLIWVTLGWLHSVGVDPQPIWDAVCAANMAKSTGPVREDGKRLKPCGWKHPDIAALVEEQRGC